MVTGKHLGLFEPCDLHDHNYIPGFFKAV